VAAGIKAILYAPGCAIATLDLPLSATSNPRYDCVCQPLRTVSITGALRSDEALWRQLKLQAKYVARWGQKFLQLDTDSVIDIPVGEVAYPGEDGRFRLTIPDLADNPLSASQDLKT